MTPKEFKEEMEKLAADSNTEDAHQKMDTLMGEMLYELGYAEGVDVFDNREKWYC